RIGPENLRFFAPNLRGHSQQGLVLQLGAGTRERARGLAGLLPQLTHVRLYVHIGILALLESEAELQELVPWLGPAADAFDGAVDAGGVGKRALDRLGRHARGGRLHRALAAAPDAVLAQEIVERAAGRGAGLDALERVELLDQRPEYQRRRFAPAFKDVVYPHVA